MPVIIVFEEDGKTKLLTNLRFAGSGEEPWNPLRVEVQIEDFAGVKVKAYQMAERLEELVVEENRIVIFPERPPKPALPPPYAYRERKKVVPMQVAYVSSVDVPCGIWTYTKFLSEGVGKLFPVKVGRTVQEAGSTALIHVQCEFGIFPYSDELVGRRTEDNYKVVTWHTALQNPGPLLEYYQVMDEHYDAHVVHNILAKKYIKAYVSKPVYIIPHGSVLWSPMSKGEARKRLGLPLDKKIVFCFGFASETKGFEDVTKVAAKMTDLTFIISAARHGVAGWHSEIVLKGLLATAPNNVVILGKYLSEEEINLYASACDCLLFNYRTPGFVSSASGALHRVLAAGRPIVSSVDNRLIELEDGYHVLKFPRGDLEQMEYCIRLVLSDNDLASTLGENARRLAEETSWQKVAQKHLELYERLVGDVYGPDWYDRSYFAGDIEAKPYFTPDGKLETWSYFNPEGDWEGCFPIMKAIKQVFNPEKVLDVGCGRGPFTAYARDAGIEAWGFDFSSWAIRNPYNRARHLIFLADARYIPFLDNSFDLVFATDIMEHIYNEDLPKVIGEIQRVSKKYIFYNIGSTMCDDEGTLTLKRGKLPPREMQATAVAGHVTVMHYSWWKKKLSSGEWVLRDDLVEKFRSLVDPRVLANWRCIIITERVGL